MLNQEEQRGLDKIWKTNMLIWGIVLTSLSIYLVICTLLEKQQLLTKDLSFPLNTLITVLFIVSMATLFVISLIRKKILNTKGPTSLRHAETGSSVSWLQQVSAKYTVAIVLSAAMSESVAI